MIGTPTPNSGMSVAAKIERVKYLRRKWQENWDENQRLSKEESKLVQEIKDAQQQNRLCEVAGHIFGPRTPTPDNPHGLQCTTCGLTKEGYYG